MHFVINCTDKPDYLAVRVENRPAHVEYLKTHGDKIIVAGPTLAEDGESMIGSLLIMQFDDLAQAEAWTADDPYNKAGLFGSVIITPWKKVFPADG